MKFFIDTANLDQIREANELGVLDGVTTNPSLMAKEGIRGVENQRKHYLEICEIVGGDVSAEVIATDLEGMIKEGEELAALHPNIVVKVPCIEAGIKAIKYFTRKGIRTNCTLVFSVGQALLAAKAGATYVSPFVGRLDDIASDGIELVRSWKCMIITIMIPKYWRLLSVAPSISSNAWRRGRMWLPVLCPPLKAY